MIFQIPVGIALRGIEMTNMQARDYAVGMIKVDGLEPTKEFQEYIEKEKRGEATMADIYHILPDLLTFFWKMLFAGK